jgi:hypothetical protein
MNDSRRRQATLYAGSPLAAVLALALFAGCGGGGSSSETATRDVHTQGTAATGGASQGSRSAPAETPTLSENDDRPAAPEHRLPNPFLCSRDPVAFNLTALDPGPGTPLGFVAAWNYAKSRSVLPGFVVAYSGTMWGPAISAQVGAVYAKAPGVYSFMEALPPSAVDTVGLNPSDPFEVRTDHRNHNFITAFGSTRVREGFVVSDVTVEGRLDQTCQYLRNVRVHMTLPEGNIGQRFGGTMIDTALGPMTSESHGHGVKDGWEITLTGETLDNLMFQL